MVERKLRRAGGNVLWLISIVPLDVFENSNHFHQQEQIEVGPRDRKYCKKKFEGILVLAAEEKGHRLWNDWKTSSALYDSKMVHRNKDEDQTHIAEKYPSANQEQEQGLCHGTIQSPDIAHSFQISSTPSQSTPTSQPAHPLLNCL